MRDNKTEGAMMVIQFSKKEMAKITASLNKTRNNGLSLREMGATENPALDLYIGEAAKDAGVEEWTYRYVFDKLLEHALLRS